MDAMLQLRLLGAPQINVAGISVAEALPNKAQAILYYLAVTGQLQPRATLATLLWGDLPEAAARANLRKALAELQQSVGAYLKIDRQTVAFRPGCNLWVDVVEFKTNLGDATRTLSITQLQNAVELYRGDFLKGFYVLHAPDFEAWMLAEQTRLREQGIQALYHLADQHAERGELAQGIGYTRRLLALEPWREEAHRQVMLLLARDGQRSAALAQYEVCRHALAEELGVEPNAETLALVERIRDGDFSQGTPPRLPAQESSGELFMAVPVPIASIPSGYSTPRHNLPLQPTPFIGREKELADIIRRLNDKNCRLLILVGPGGIGKTRLALQAAQTLVDAHPPDGFFAHGILFIQLAAVSATSGIVSAIAEAANFNFYSNVPPQQQLLDYLREKEMLLVLDNFEHLLTHVSGNAGGAELITAILAAAPRVKILVTSREALNLQEAWFHPVKGMAFPPLPQDFSQPQAQDTDSASQSAHTDTGYDLKAYDAVQLFWQSARRAQLGFSLNVEQEHVIRICRLVEGMPLGIELAAAWLKVMPAGKIADEIERGLDILSTRLQNVPERHRSIRAVFEHSWRLLSTEERDVLERLSVFRGSFTQEAAEQVADASLPTLATLVEKSLVQTTASGRYQLHELLQQFARTKLAKSAQETATQAQHSAYYLTFLRAHETMLTGPEQRQALDDIGQEINNIQVGWRWVVEQGHLEAIAQVLESLYLYYQIRGRYREGQEIFAQATAYLPQVAAPTESAPLETVCRMLAARQGAFCYYLGDLDAADVLLQTSLTPQTPPSEAAFAMGILGDIASLQGNQTLAQERLRQSVTLSRDSGNMSGAAKALTLLSFLTINHYGQFAEAKQLAIESLAISRRLGRPDSIAQGLDALVVAALYLGDYGELEAYIKEHHAICQEMGEPPGIALSYHSLGWLAVTIKDASAATKAIAYCEQAVAMFREIGHRSNLALSLGTLGFVACELGEYERGLPFAREGAALAVEIGNLAFQAYCLCFLGALECGLGQVQAGRAHLLEALQITYAKQMPGYSIYALFYLGALLAKESEAAGATESVKLQQRVKALELLTLIGRHPVTEPFFKDKALRLQAEIEAILPHDSAATAKAQGKSRTLEEVVTEVLTNLEVARVVVSAE